MHLLKNDVCVSSSGMHCDFKASHKLQSNSYLYLHWFISCKRQGRRLVFTQEQLAPTCASTKRSFRNAHLLVNLDDWDEGVRSKSNLINFSCTSGKRLICLCTCRVCDFYIFKQSKYTIIMKKRQKVSEPTIFLKNECEEKTIDVNITMFWERVWARARRMQKESWSQ